MTSLQEAESVAQAIESEMGPIDILINNAGVASMKYVWDLTEEGLGISASMSMPRASSW